MRNAKTVFAIVAAAIILVAFFVFFFVGNQTDIAQQTERPATENKQPARIDTPIPSESEKTLPVASEASPEDFTETAPSADGNTTALNNASATQQTETESATLNETDVVSTSLYSVADGYKLDVETFEGFKLYRNWCARCHGTYGQGMVGPNLAESLARISQQEFIDVVTKGKLGQIGSMPAWESNPMVMSGMDNLYAYLKARSDGAIGEVKPAKQ